MKLYCYHIPPIDFWFGAITGKQLFKTVWESYPEAWGEIANICREMERLKAEAEKEFKKIGWDGDVRDGPYYFALPSDIHMSIGYIVKQDNNGSCFIASPQALPSLDNLAFEKMAIG